MRIKKKDRPYFFINGHNFHVARDSESESNVSITKTNMYVPKNNWGYRDIMFNNFLGEDLDLTIFSYTYEVYTGDQVQPPDGTGISDFYSTPRTPHAVLKYWQQNGVPCIVNTNIQAHENGEYIIDSGMRQTSPTPNFIVTQLTLIQSETPSDVNQTYYRSDDAYKPNNSFSANLSASALEIGQLGNHSKTCNCTENSNPADCQASSSTDVIIIQQYLQQWGYLPRHVVNGQELNVSGQYCIETQRAIEKFQRDVGLTVTGRFDAQVKRAFINKLTKF